MLNFLSFFAWQGVSPDGNFGWWLSKTEEPPAGVVTRPHGPFEDMDAAKRYLRKSPKAEKAILTFTYRCPDFRKDYRP